ncbi:MAG: sulfur carrier protein ThiS [Bacteroidota bacterium]
MKTRAADLAAPAPTVLASDMDSPDISIRVNGDPREVPEGLSLRDVLAHLGRDPDLPGVAVAVDDRVVRRALWPETTVEAGARIEVITASQGG